MKNSLKTETVRIFVDDKKYCKEIGKGNVRRGISLLCHDHNERKKNPEQIVMEKIDKAMVTIQELYPDHYRNHFHNLPAFIRVGLRKGDLDFSILDNGNEDKENKEV